MDAPATPPAHVRVVSLEEHEKQIRTLQNQRAEDYEHLRDIGQRVSDLAARSGERHLLEMSAIGELARQIAELAATLKR